LHRSSGAGTFVPPASRTDLVNAMDSLRSPAPRVSIVIPTYNAAPYLSMTLDSVLGQTISDIEVILFDDGSTDGTLRIADEFAARDGRVRVLRGDHGGTAAARNRGFAASDPRSEFVTFFDNDDVWERDALESLISALERSPEAPGAHGLCRSIDSHGVQFPWDNISDVMRQREAVVGDDVKSVPLTEPTSFAALLIKNYITTPGVSLIRRSAFEQVGEFDPSLVPCDDWDMNLRISRLGAYVFVDRVLLSWRRHAGASSQVSKSWRYAYQRTRQRTIDAPENTPLQRQAAVYAVRNEVMVIQREAVQLLRDGSIAKAVKRFARSLMLATIWLRIPVLSRT
jgi:glycosyltransferase involved in cell wall biosynthesis